MHSAKNHLELLQPIYRPWERQPVKWSVTKFSCSLILVLASAQKIQYQSGPRNDTLKTNDWVTLACYSETSYLYFWMGDIFWTSFVPSLIGQLKDWTEIGGGGDNMPQGGIELLEAWSSSTRPLYTGCLLYKLSY